MDDPDVVLGLLILGAHLSVLVWAISNKQPWWALGIFFFPVIGDIAYAIYHFSTREALRGEKVKTADELAPGDTVTAKARLYDSHGQFALKKGEEAVVLAVDPPPKRVTVRTSSGKKVGGLRPTAFLVDRTVAERGVSNADALQVSPASSQDFASDVRPQLEELARLHEDGLISDDEFVAKKRQVLGLD